MKSQRTRSKISRCVIYIILFSLVILMVMPFAWMLLSSFKEENEVFTYDMTWLPSKITLSGYRRALTRQPLLLYGLNTVIVSTVITFCQLITSVLAGVRLLPARVPWKKLHLPHLYFSHDDPAPGTDHPLLYAHPQAGVG